MMGSLLDPWQLVVLRSSIRQVWIESANIQVAYLLSASDVVCPKLASCLLDSKNCVWLSTVYQVTDAEILIGADVHSGDQGYRSLTYTCTWHV